MMKSNKQKIELLAPAGNLESGTAAINCGADAVYIGPERFGAREAAGNSIADIEKLCSHAHKYWARVYATVNTILRDDELAEAQRLISSLYEAGVDGLIIQDTGLLELDLPPLPLIASTQMHNSTPEKVAFLEAVGFDRVILARELSLEQIREIRQKTSVELECFVHGALCVCYSGQCYLSYAIGGRSGNRGQCAQPCRRRYRLEDSSGKSIAEPAYFLSLKDLNLAENLAELIDAGIASFKIEGRLKDTAYVINTVGFFRRKLDRLLEQKDLRKGSSGTVSLNFFPDLHKTFNRGYWTYFLKDRSKEVASPHTPTWLGEYAGTAARVGTSSFVMHSDLELHNGDGICFFDSQKQLRGTVINKVQGTTIFPDKMQGLERGAVVYRNHDHRFLQSLRKNYAERRISLSLELTEAPDGLLLRAEDEDGNAAEFSLACEKKIAEKKEQALATIRRQLLKLGETDFSSTHLDINTTVAYFIPVSVLNSLRRGAVEAIIAERAKNRPVKKGGVVKNSVPFPEKKLSYLSNILNAQAADFYRRHGVQEIEPAAETGLGMQGRKVMTTKYCIRYQFDLCPKKKGADRMSDPLYLVDHERKRYRLGFDCKACCMEIYME